MIFAIWLKILPLIIVLGNKRGKFISISDIQRILDIQLPISIFANRPADKILKYGILCKEKMQTYGILCKENVLTPKSFQLSDFF